MANLLPSRLSHNYGTNLALPGTMQINYGTVPPFCSPNFNYLLLGCMTHTAPSDSCFLAPDINTLTYLLTLPSTRVLDKILDRVFEQ